MKRNLWVAISIMSAVAAAFAVPVQAHAASIVVSSILNHSDVLATFSAHAMSAFGIGSVALAAAASGTPSTQDLATQSKFFRVAVEGATTDGRTILREWIQQMAASYNTTTYGARVNMEHIRGYAPAPASPFGAYGDVLALQAKEIEEGPLKGKLALYAQISPTNDLVNLTKARQKIYSSIEIDPSFADTKEAYLVGLAVTDSPASLGTEMLTFASQNPAVFAGRKLSPSCLFSVAEETEIEFEDVQPKPGVSVFAKVKELLGFVKTKGAADDSRFADVTQAVEALATHGAAVNTQLEAYAQQVAANDAVIVELTKRLDASDLAFKTLHEQLSTTSAWSQRPPATGTRAETKTDC